jgi:Kdo2-lipid IVA lauroyltransferase/acyltransferase
VSRLLLGLIWLIHLLPLGLQAAIGGAIGRAMFWLVRSRRRVTRINLAKCFPHMDPAARERLARAHFRAFARSFVERGILWWAPRARIERLIRVEGLEHVRALAGTPVILFVPHFVGLDAAATRLGCDLDMVGIYQRQKDQVLLRILLHGRGRFGNQRQVSRNEGARVAIRAMVREHRPFFYLPDLDHGPRDAVFVPFFGVPTATVTGLSRLARVTGARVVPCITRQLPGAGGYITRFYPAWEDFPGPSVEDDTRRMNAFIEDRAREMPEQYYWLHKRFKTRPPGEPRFY